ncbi:MAG: desulfoferrodoxin FeS4 iron-binding domain-containing protein [Deltaproteobacteria bacterium]|nr:desulfoferrodoxin FeS4 iron-binding domain-containing protein [Deltaproteobacteria bacterium]
MATSAGQEYRGKVCGNKVKVMEAGGGVLVCGGVPMKLEGAS